MTRADARSHSSICPILTRSLSGHAAAATAVAVTVALAHPTAGPIVLPVAALVAYSRVALRVHHVSDVLGGVVLGLGGAIAATRLFR